MATGRGVAVRAAEQMRGRRGGVQRPRAKYCRHAPPRAAYRKFWQLGEARSSRLVHLALTANVHSTVKRQQDRCGRGYMSCHMFMIPPKAQHAWVM